MPWLPVRASTSHSIRLPFSISEAHILWLSVSFWKYGLVTVCRLVLIYGHNPSDFYLPLSERITYVELEIECFARLRRDQSTPQPIFRSSMFCSFRFLASFAKNSLDFIFRRPSVFRLIETVVKIPIASIIRGAICAAQQSPNKKCHMSTSRKPMSASRRRTFSKFLEHRRTSDRLLAFLTAAEFCYPWTTRTWERRTCSAKLRSEFFRRHGTWLAAGVGLSIASAPDSHRFSSTSSSFHLPLWPS